MNDTARWLAGASLLVGAWILVSAFVLEMPDSHYWNNIVVGAAIVVLAGYTAFRAMEGSVKGWAAGLAGLLGLWMVATPFVYETVGDTILWSDVLSGAVVAILGGYVAYRASRTEEAATTERQAAQ